MGGGRSDTTVGPMIPQGGARLPRRRSARAAAQPGTTRQFARCLVEHDRAILAAHDDVLDAGPVFTGVVDPRLDAECHAGREWHVVAGDEVRILVSVEADAVARPVEERLTVAGRVDHRARGGVDLLARDARSDGPRPAGLRLVQDLEQIPETLVRTRRRVSAVDPQRSGDVRTVSAERSADIEDDRLPGADDAVRRLVVRGRGVRARGDDRELGRVVPFLDECVTDLACHVGLGAANEPASRDPLDDAVRGVGGGGQQRDLIRVLDHAQVAQDRRRQ